MVIQVVALKAQSLPRDTVSIYFADTVKVTGDPFVPMTGIKQQTTKILIPLHENPISLDIVPRRMLRDQQATLLSDALQNISSITIQNASGAQEIFLIRGFESTNGGLILTDGIDEPDVSLYRFYGFGQHDLYNIEQVEVLKGPASFLFGANTLSGAINMSVKKPQTNHFCLIQSSLGKFGYVRNSVDVNLAVIPDYLLLRLNGLFQDNSSFRKRATRMVAINPLLTWKMDQDRTVTLCMEYVNNHTSPDSGIPLFYQDSIWQMPAVPLRTSYQSSFDKLQHRTGRVRLDYRWQIRKNIEMSNRFYYTGLDGTARLTLLQIPYFTMSDGLSVGRHIYTFDERQRFCGNQTEFSWDHPSGSFENRILLGFEFNYLDNQSEKMLTQLPRVNLFQPRADLVASEEALIRYNAVSTTARNRVLAAYWVQYLKITPKFQVFYGGRLDYIAFKTNRINDPFDFISQVFGSQPVPMQKSDIQFSPMIGLVLKDSEQLWLYCNAGQAFGNGLRYVDRPEQSRQFEIGYHYLANDQRLQNSVGVFTILKHRMAIPMQGPLQGNVYASTGSQRSGGLEFDLTLHPHQRWYLFGNFTMIDAELLNYRTMAITSDIKTRIIDFSGNYPAFVPAQVSNVWVTYITRVGLGAGFGVRYQSHQYVHIDNEFKIKPALIANVMASFERNGISCRLHYRNLAEHLQLGRGIGPYAVIPDPSSRFYVTCEVEIR